MSDGRPALTTEQLRFGYPGQSEFLGPLDFSCRGGEFWGVIGPNGAGKSTLLRLCAGLLAPTRGRVLLNGRSVGAMAPLERAQQMAFLPQRPIAPPAATVREIVLLGRYPHRRYHVFESPEDERVAEDALTRTETLVLADRPMETLSGGEAQRVHLAAALAQQPRLLVLDEPTTALDPYHQVSILSILRSLAGDRGLAIVVATHDLNLAGRFCDRLLLLADGRAVCCGIADEVLAPATLERVYRVPFRSIEDPQDGRRYVWPVVGDKPPSPPAEGD
ncbi:MAG TPA: ABC transporter ATP-binding protein [Phycisphaerae bacterium]|nr:ABC transporter ATP-binding protein [Phycisphaerae bacterium]